MTIELPWRSGACPDEHDDRWARLCKRSAEGLDPQGGSDSAGYLKFRYLAVTRPPARATHALRHLGPGRITLSKSGTPDQGSYPRATRAPPLSTATPGPARVPGPGVAPPHWRRVRRPTSNALISPGPLSLRLPRLRPGLSPKRRLRPHLVVQPGYGGYGSTGVARSPRGGQLM